MENIAPGSSHNNAMQKERESKEKHVILPSRYTKNIANNFRKRVHQESSAGNREVQILSSAVMEATRPVPEHQIKALQGK